MSKDLKEEYEHMLDSGMPDLWDRIEPQLHEKKTEKKGINRSKRIYLYSGMAAACLCLAIAIPAIIRTRDNGMQNSTGSYMMADETASAENNGMADGAEDGGMMGESMAAQEDDASDMQGINESATMSSESAMENMTLWDGDSYDAAIPEDYEDDVSMDDSMNSDGAINSMDAEDATEAEDEGRKNPQNLQDSQQTVRLPGDSGEKLEVKGRVLKVFGEETYTNYEMIITEVNGQVLSGEESRIHAISTKSLTEEHKNEQADDTVHALIQWDEGQACYRILEIL